MEATLLQTKLFVPQVRSELVTRPRLAERLEAGSRGRLTLVSAPAGFGKTTLVGEWVQAMNGATPPIAVAWLALDESDNDPIRFLTYFVAALQAVQADVGKGALIALQSPQPPPAEAVLTDLINEIAALSDRMVLVLDDYHLIEAQPIHDALAFLLRRMPPQLHLIITTREDPPMPLSRLRARGQLTELRATDLRFTVSEAAEFLNQAMGLNLSPEAVAALEQRTEGWIAGLQLAAVSMQGRKDASSFIESFTGSHRHILDYLVEEVLEQQPKSVQTFLLQTAILDRLTGSLCDAMRFGEAETRTEEDNGQATLETLERANLFIIPLDDDRHWYRYHHLFADLLRRRLRQIQPEQVPVLQRRASAWYEQNGFVDEAIEHALRAEDSERAADLVGGHAETLWGRGELVRLMGWLDVLPLEQMYARPLLCIFRAWGLATSGQQSAAEQYLQAAERAIDPATAHKTETVLAKRDQMPDSKVHKIQGRAAAIRAFMASFRGDIPVIIQYARQALDCLPEHDLAWRSSAAIVLGDAYVINGELEAAGRARVEALEASKATGNWYMILMASLKLTWILRHAGKLQEIINICQQRWQAAYDNGLSKTPVVGWLLAVWGEALAERNDLDAAKDRAERGAELTERGSDVAMISMSYVCLTRVLFSAGDLAGTQEVLDKLQRLSQKTHVPPWLTNLTEARQARIWLAQNKLDAVSQWVQECRLDADDDPVYQLEIGHMVLARLLIAQGRQDEALRLLQRLLESAQACGRTSRAIEILMLQALAFQALGDTTQVIDALERALALAEPNGFIRIFVDEGPPMARLLYEALSHGIAPDYVRQLLSAFPVTEPGQSAPSENEASESKLIEPLSEREIEVLHLIAEGLTNQEIASRLYLTLNTIKSHSRNIYGKLDVHSRTQAVARAQALGLLSRG